jgi:ABC-type transport system involved in multi-copper enzyme maturation permease subunit
MTILRVFSGIVSFGLAALFGFQAYCCIALTVWSPWGSTSSTSSLEVLGVTFSGWQIYPGIVALIVITVACLIGGVYAFRSRKFVT